MKKKKKKSPIVTVLLILILLAGLGFLLYPTLSDWLNRYRQGKLIEEYNGSLRDMDDGEKQEVVEEARAYNERLARNPARWNLSDEDKKEYTSMLNAAGTGVMGYVEIPDIKVSLPIYHGTDEAVLQTAIGHLEGSSLPVGGKGTHAVISGHRGLPSAKLFTDIDQLEEGDRFWINIPGETLTYEIDRISVVLPEEFEELAIDPEEDYCTLMTCTPYGVNTHRLLVRGVRVPTAEKPKETSVIEISPILLIPLVAAPVLLVVIIVLLVRTRKRKKKDSSSQNK